MDPKTNEIGPGVYHAAVTHANPALFAERMQKYAIREVMRRSKPQTKTASARHCGIDCGCTTAVCYDHSSLRFLARSDGGFDWL